jgi:transcriptional regulator with XRE-family HTH domain
MNAKTTTREATKAKVPSKPRVTVAEYLTAQIDLCGKSQLEIAREIGFEKPNIITMFKQGKSKLPIGRVEAMAKALGVDPTYLYSLCMQEYEPDVWPIVQKMMQRNGLTETQSEVLEILDSTGVPNPVIRTVEERERIFNAFSKLRPANTVSGD